MSVSQKLTDEEIYLFCILDDPSGIDLAEFVFLDETPGKRDPCFRVRDYQWSWWLCDERYQIDGCSRDVGKTQGLLLRAFAFPFNFPGQEMLITAPQLNHLGPIVDKVEGLFMRIRLGREMLPKQKGGGIKHQPQFQASFINGAKILGRLPGPTGAGLKGQHAHRLEMDEAQDVQQNAWMEVIETMKDTPGSQWRAHGVSRGVRDMYYRLTMRLDPSLPFYVHKYVAMHRPGWSATEREAKIALYGGSRDNPDYKRNVLGEHGDVSNPVFVLARLMSCWAPETQIHLADGSLKSVQNIAIGDTVLNAVGTGTVTDVMPTPRDRLVEIEVAGEVLHCTPEHPFFTRRGWVNADALVQDDELLDFEAVSALWEDADLADTEAVLFSGLRRGSVEDEIAGSFMRDMWKPSIAFDATPVLFQEVLGSVRDGEASGLRGMRRTDLGCSASDVLTGVCGIAATQEEPPTRDGMSVLRSEDLGREGQFPVLQQRVLERQSSAFDRGEDLQAVRGGVSSQARPEVLLAQLLSEVGGDHLWRDGEGRSRSEDLQALRDRVRASGQEGQVLLAKMCQRMDHGQAASDAAMQTMRTGISASASDPRLVQQGVLVRQQGKGSASRSGPLDQRGKRGTASGSVDSVGGTRGQGQGLGTGVLDVLNGTDSRHYSVHARHGTSGDQDQCGSRWVGALVREGGGTGSNPRRVASIPRVDRVEVLEQGSPGFARLSGGEDTVTVYDLTVSGHPSYCIGQRGFLVHNCTRINESTWATEYNENIYAKRKLDYEYVQGAGIPIQDHLKLPSSHLLPGYKSYWAGMDLGFTNDPSELLVFGLIKVGEKDVLRLLTRVHMMRIPAVDQAHVIEAVADFYGERLKAISMDRTGNGLPVWQETVRGGRLERLSTKIKGYGFSEKRAVAFDDRELERREKPTDAMIEKNIIEFATDTLRSLVDGGQIELPFDQELLTEFQGQTIQYSSDPSTNKPTRYGGGSYHTLDAAKLAVLGRALEHIESVMKPRRSGPVLDQFFQ